MAYRSIVRGMTAPCRSRKLSRTDWSFLPTSRSIQPVALWIRSSLSTRSSLLIASVSSNWPWRMKCCVETMAIRRSHRLFDFASANSGSLGPVIRNPPTTCGAEQSTKSQLLMNRVLLRYRSKARFR